MRALVADGTSPDRIAIHEVAEPVPAADEVLVEVRAFSINRGELRMLRTAPDGWRPGWDFAGILRSDVDGGPQSGSRVVGVQRGGTWAERVAVPQLWIAELPTNVSFAEAAALPTAGLTALRTLRSGPAILGRRVLVTGASGGVGRFAIQLARLGGAEVTALVSGTSARTAGLRELGAAAVVSDIGQLRGRFDLILNWSGRHAGLSDDDRRATRDAGHVRQQLGRAHDLRCSRRLQRCPRSSPGVRTVLWRRAVRS